MAYGGCVRGIPGPTGSGGEGLVATDVVLQRGLRSVRAGVVS